MNHSKTNPWSKIAALALLTALPLSVLADPIVSWNQDSASGFSVNISGVLSTQGDTGVLNLSSPTGLWSVNYLGSLVSFFGDGTAFDGAAHLDAAATTGSFSGDQSFSFGTPGGYGCMIWELPYTSGNALGSLDINGAGWSGMTQTAFLAASNIDDLSTWAYSIDINLNGPIAQQVLSGESGPINVPDSTLTLGLLSLAMAGIILLRRRNSQ